MIVPGVPAVDQHEIPFKERRFRNRKLRRGIFLLPSLFTVGNLLCGFYAAGATLIGRVDDFDHAAKAIGLAILFDSMDGRIARLTGTNTEFGVQFDSLADVVSFGIAPGLLAYSWGVRHLPEFDHSALIQQIGHFGWWFCFAFVVCCAWRLARFNVQGMAPGGSKYFVGMPTPAAAGVVAATVHAFPDPLQNKTWAITWICITLALAALMTSTIRFYSFKDIPWTRKQPSLAVVLVAVLIAAIWRWSEIVLFLMASTYAATGLLLHLIRFVRHRFTSRPA